MNHDVVVLLSGGLDSSTLLFEAKRAFDRVLALTITYGQRHRREIYAAQRVAKEAGLPCRVIHLDSLLPVFSKSALTDPLLDVPQGHYAAETMKITVVPNRNMVLISVAAAYAISHDCSVVGYAAHAGDHAIYPDCRLDFVQAMARALQLCSEPPLQIYTPFIQRTKADIVDLAVRLHVPLHLTWSCYEGREKHCGKCGTCVERREAFKLASIPDPTDYEEC